MIKRVFDLSLSLVLCTFLLPVLLCIALAILLLDGWPVFFVSERMKALGKPFRLIKFRTMRPDMSDSGATGAHKYHRITRTGHFLRRSRLDELPQLWNVIRGDMSFVGPRPPLRCYVENYPEIYGAVLKNRPGVTGLASIYFHAHEEFLLSKCSNAEESESVYVQFCVPRKARLDLIYQKNQNICLDISLMLKTVIKSMR